MWKSLLTIPFIFAFAACDSGGGGSEDSTTYSISGTLDTGATASSLSANRMGWDVAAMAFDLRARTACDDGQFYSVFCMTFTSPPVAAEGDVTCDGTNGAFTVAGLPKGEPIFCVVRRYEDATATTGTNVGAIEIPTANLSGSSDTIVGNGNLTMAVTMSADGTITAEVTGETGDSSNDEVDNFFSPGNANGTWRLACDNNNGGTQFSAGACKCFLSNSYGGTSYGNQDDCLDDPNGPGSEITGNVFLDIDMFIHPVTTASDLEVNNQTIPAGTDMKAISIWASTAKTGGEGVTDLGGALTWDTTVEDPTTAITWTTSAVTVKDGSDSDITFTVPAITNANTMDHEDWITWAQAVAAAAEAQNFNCTWGPNDSDGVLNDDLDGNVECINQVIEALTDDSIGATIPRIRLQPYCDQNGCLISADAQDSALDYYNANTFNFVRVDFEDWHLDYPNDWLTSHNYNDGQANDANPDGDGIGVSPQSRFVFEPLVIHPNGAGFRQGHHGERHYRCVDSGAGNNDVTNAACSDNMAYYELVCHYTEQLAIKFIGTASPMDVIFDSLESPVAARLIKHDGSGTNEIAPTGTNEIDMCETANGVSGFTFFASGTKQ